MERNALQKKSVKYTVENQYLQILSKKIFIHEFFRLINIDKYGVPPKNRNAHFLTFLCPLVTKLISYETMSILQFCSKNLSEITFHWDYYSYAEIKSKVLYVIKPNWNTLKTVNKKNFLLFF